MSPPATMAVVRASAWHNGGPRDEPAGYGIKLTASDRDRYFRADWEGVVVDLKGGEAALVKLTPSFWRTCSELRSAAIGRWLLDQHAAPWPASNPPGILVRHLAENRFSARVLVRRALL